MSVKALIITPDGDVSVRDIEPDLDTLQALVGGWLEAIYGVFSTAWHAYVNEEGKLQELTPNIAATMVAHLAGWKTPDVLVGTAVFLGTGEDGAEADVPGELINLAQRTRRKDLG